MRGIFLFFHHFFFCCKQNHNRRFVLSILFCQAVRTEKLVLLLYLCLMNLLLLFQIQ